MEYPNTAESKTRRTIEKYSVEAKMYLESDTWEEFDFKRKAAGIQRKKKDDIFRAYYDSRNSDYANMREKESIADFIHIGSAVGSIIGIVFSVGAGVTIGFGSGKVFAMYGLESFFVAAFLFTGAWLSRFKTAANNVRTAEIVFRSLGRIPDVNREPVWKIPFAPE